MVCRFGKIHACMTEIFITPERQAKTRGNSPLCVKATSCCDVREGDTEVGLPLTKPGI